MEHENFKASTQYNDWKGTVAADNADMNSFNRYLRDVGKIDKNEVAVGIIFYSELKFININAFIRDANENLRHITVDLSITEFFEKFKRFSIYLSIGGQFDGKDIKFENDDGE